MELITLFRSWTSPVLDKVLGLVTDLGSTKFYLIAIPVVYWCLDRLSGYVIGLTVLLGGVATDISKGLINAPRPFQVDPSVNPSEHFLATATGSGMPSGHAFNSMAFWLASSFRCPRAWFRAFAAFLVLLIGFTRLYGGVHFPLQVLWGWLAGALCAILVAAVVRQCALKQKYGFRRMALGIALAVLVLYALIPSLRSGSGGDYVGLAGIAGGMSLGYYLHLGLIRTSAAGPLIKQLAKLLIGFAGFLALKELADLGAQRLPQMLLPLYFLLGLWPSFFATALFKLFKLEKDVV